MNANAPSHGEFLSAAWRESTNDILSPAYRTALSRLTNLTLADVPVEANVSHYKPGAWLGPHVDLEDKIATHVFYFNDAWEEKDGGGLTVLRSSDASDVAANVQPLIGNSVVLVRSDKSWHAVSRVRDELQESRRSLTSVNLRATKKFCNRRVNGCNIHHGNSHLERDKTRPCFVASPFAGDAQSAIARTSTCCAAGLHG